MKLRMKSGLLLLVLGVVAGAANDEVRLVGSKDDLAQWREPRSEWFTAAGITTNATNPRLLAAQAGQGLIVNGKNGRAKNLLSQQEFGDVEVHVEFLIPPKSNSGVYLMGRYEIQVFDSHGTQGQYPGIECGGIYQRWANGKGFEGHSPCVNASKPAGEWQSFDITFRAPRFDAAGRKIANAAFLKVVHNSQVVHENVELTGPTRAAHYADERATGPLMLQGDHGPVAYRNLVVRPLAAK
jgi:hypothetical protein